MIVYPSQEKTPSNSTFGKSDDETSLKITNASDFIVFLLQTSSVEELKALKIKQRQEMNERVLKTIEDKTKLSPEMRVLRISNDGKVFLSFNNYMVFPNNFTDILNVRIAKKDLNDTKSANDARLLD